MRGKKKTLPDFTEYASTANPKAWAGEIPVYCAHDAIVPVETLQPNPKNPNDHPEEQIQLLAYVIRSQGWRAPITISNRSGMVVRGHGRLLAALENKSTTVPIDYQNYGSEAEEYADLVADNRLAELSAIDDLKLAEIFNSTLLEADLPLILSGYTQEEYSNILAELSKADLVMESAEDVLPEIEYPVITQTGDVWVLGEHRLICGDGTRQEVLAELLQGERVQLIVTDPPYNVDYEGAAGKIANDNMPALQFRLFLEDAFEAMCEHSAPGAAAYVFHSDSEGANFRGAFSKAGFILKQVLIWCKNQFVLGRQDYQWQHEPILYGWKEGAAHFFRDTRSESTVWKTEDPVDIADMSKKQLQTFIRKHLNPADIPSTLLYEDKPLRNDLHPTMKPIALIGKCISNSSVIGWAVLDPFGGSGSTLIACDALTRRGRLAEIEPSICDVIVRRYLNVTGREDIALYRGGQLEPPKSYQGIFTSVLD